MKRISSKRIFDLFLSSLFLLLFSLPMLLIATVSRLALGSPVLFRQQRPGLNGQPFILYKFRTMKQPDACGGLLTDDERLTPLGSFLRRSSLDELPELFNVLRGDMSLVGPRPLLMEYLTLYTPQQMRRHEVRPGITGLAQVNGRNSLSWEDRFRLDTWYVDNHNLLLDIRILFNTIDYVITQRSVNRAGHATMPRYTGGGHDA